MFLLFIILSGFLSGVSLLLLSSTLNFWLVKLGVEKIALGFFSVSMLPYSISFLWAPIFDINLFKRKFSKNTSYNSSNINLKLTSYAASRVEIPTYTSKNPEFRSYSALDTNSQLTLCASSNINLKLTSYATISCINLRPTSCASSNINLKLTSYAASRVEIPTYASKNPEFRSCSALDTNSQLISQNDSQKSYITWLFILILGLVASLILISCCATYKTLIVFAFFAAFFSASKDIILGVMRIELMKANTLYEYSGFYIASYRVGMFFGGSVPIFLSTKISWQNIYILFALLLFFFSIILIYIYFYLTKKHINPDFSVNINMQDDETLSNKAISSYTKEIDLKDNLKTQIDTIFKANSINFSKKNNHFTEQFKYIISTFKKFWILILFLFLYKLPDNLVFTMINAFLIEQLYSDIEIGYSKSLGIFGSIFGGIIFSFITKNKLNTNLPNYLLQFVILHIFSYIFLSIQASYPRNIGLLFCGTLISTITGSMMMSCYITLITIKSQGENQATKYAFFTGIMGFTRVILPIISGVLLSYIGWFEYFLLCAFLTLPSILILYFKPNIFK